MTKTFITRIRIAMIAMFGGLLMAVSAAPAAHAADPVIETAKSSGQIGERIDGYLGIVEGASVDPATLRRVEEINALRRAAYADLARKTGATIEAVARVTGEKQVDRTSAGEFYLDDSGVWKRK